MINCEIILILKWSENRGLTDIITHDVVIAQGDNSTRPSINDPTSVKFKITDTKLYVQIVTLSTKNDKKLLDQLKTGFKRTIKWGKKKCRSEMSIQAKNYNLNDLIDPAFTKVNRLFVLSF